MTGILVSKVIQFGCDPEAIPRVHHLINQDTCLTSRAPSLLCYDDFLFKIYKEVVDSQFHHDGTLDWLGRSINPLPPWGKEPKITSLRANNEREREGEMFLRDLVFFINIKILSIRRHFSKEVGLEILSAEPSYVCVRLSLFSNSR